MPVTSCVHCGLPVVTMRGSETSDLFCCYGCRLASCIVGGRDGGGAHAWNILRLGIGALLSMNVMMVALLLYTGEVEPQAVHVFRWIMFAVSTPAMLILGYPLVLGSLRDLAQRRLSLDILIAGGSFAAFLISAVNTLRGLGYVYFDTATMLPLLVTFGRLIEAAAKTRTGELLRGLETLLPSTALRIEGGCLTEVQARELRIGDCLRIRPGERFAVDGCVIEGRSTIEEAAFTGESSPRDAGPGDAVIAGTINGPGALVIRAGAVGEQMLLSRIVGMVHEAWRTTGAWERISDRAASFLIIATLGISAAAALFWTLCGNPERGGLAALAVAVVACPCAMGIATPLATALAVGRAARSGVLVRGGDVLERIGQVRTVFFDKTGTITTNEPAIVKIQLAEIDVNENDVLGWLGGLETSSEHVLAKAVLREARRRGLDIGSVADVTVHPGLGIEGTVKRLGQSRVVTAGADLFTGVRSTAEEEPLTVIHVAWDGKVQGRVYLADQIRPDAADAVARLHEQRIETLLLSGDRQEVAELIARQAGIQRSEAPRRPEEKIEAIRNSRCVTAMVGDGINDIPALAAADVGIALGAGTDLARYVGNVVLLSDQLIQIPWLVELSRTTRRLIAQNLAWASVYNAIALTAAAAGWLHPLLAALAMVVSSLTVLTNSLRIRRFPDAENEA